MQELEPASPAMYVTDLDISPGIFRISLLRFLSWSFLLYRCTHLRIEALSLPFATKDFSFGKADDMRHHVTGSDDDDDADSTWVLQNQLPLRFSFQH
jgi:hypothetical protein